jgi:AcrR family transcriptional regulator
LAHRSVRSPAEEAGLSADRLADVLDATCSCLIRYGVWLTSMDDIAGETGVSRSALYQ